MSKCRSCDAEIVWARHQGTGRLAPLDAPWPVPNRQGNVVVVSGEEGDDAPRYYIDQPPGDESGRTTNHFATCPDAAAHR